MILKKKCPKCGSRKTNKDGTRPIYGDRFHRRVQAYVCNNCWHQWRES